MSRNAYQIAGSTAGRFSAIAQQGSFLKPFLNDALFWLDGVIIEDGGNKYFRDITGNDRKFLITDYDFNSDWTAGMPYKTAATISAPVGDATLIAADVNNYLYDSGGTPNQIPVVSLFQDIDYEHKLFCKHYTRLIDSSEIEIREPRVVHIVLYDTVKVGTELTLCQNYFDVPTEDLTAEWIAEDGNDTTGTGTKANPWRSVDKIKATTASTVYAKSGNYDLTARVDFNAASSFELKSVGFASWNLYNGTAYGFFNYGEVTITGFVTTAPTINYAIYNYKSLTFRRCSLTKTDGTAFERTRSGATGVYFYDNVTNLKGGHELYESNPNELIVEGNCGRFDTGAFAIFGLTTKYKHNKLIGGSRLYITMNDNLEVIDNHIESDGTLVPLEIKSGVATPNYSGIKVNYNYIKTSRNSSYILYIGGTTESTPQIANGTEVIGNKIINDYVGASSCHSMLLGGGVDYKIKYNYVDSKSGYGIVVKSGGEHFTTTDAHISYNIIKADPLNNPNPHIYIRGAYGVIASNNTIIGVGNTTSANPVFGCNDDASGLDNSLLVINNVIQLSANTDYYTYGTNITKRNNSINKNGFTLTQAIDANDEEITVAIDDYGVPAQRINFGEVVSGDNNVGLASNYYLNKVLAYKTQDSNWQRGAVLLS